MLGRNSEVAQHIADVPSDEPRLALFVRDGSDLVSVEGEGG